MANVYLYLWLPSCWKNCLTIPDHLLQNKKSIQKVQTLINVNNSFSQPSIIHRCYITTPIMFQSCNPTQMMAIGLEKKYGIKVLSLSPDELCCCTTIILNLSPSISSSQNRNMFRRLHVMIPEYKKHAIRYKNGEPEYTTVNFSSSYYFAFSCYRKLV